MPIGGNILGADTQATPPVTVCPGPGGRVRWTSVRGERGDSALKYDFTPYNRHVGLDVLDLIFRHGHVVRRENHQVGQLSWLNCALPSFLERVTCSRTCIKAQRL